jgi:hypothetical protein
MQTEANDHFDMAVQVDVLSRSGKVDPASRVGNDDDVIGHIRRSRLDAS